MPIVFLTDDFMQGIKKALEGFVATTKMVLEAGAVLHATAIAPWRQGLWPHNARRQVTLLSWHPI